MMLNSTTLNSVTLNSVLVTVTSYTVDHTTDVISSYLSEPVWVSPVNGAGNIVINEYLVFIIPPSAQPIHFHIQIDLVNTFDTVNLLEFKSWQNQTNWDYWNGLSWVKIPSGGVPTMYAGNQARFKPTLDVNTYYRRIRGRLSF